MEVQAEVIQNGYAVYTKNYTDSYIKRVKIRKLRLSAKTRTTSYFNIESYPLS